MNRGIVVALALVLLVAAHPMEQVLRASAPAAAQSHRLGTGRLLGSVLTGPFRPLLLTYLWIRGDNLYGEGRYEETYQLYRFINQLYPNNARARNFIGWLLAYNLKSEAPNIALGWRWSEQGLDILLESEDGPSWVADWIRKQAGQNSIYLQRYAGKPWEEEKLWRARLRGWGRRRFGEDLGRFELGILVLKGRDGLIDRARRTQMLEQLAYEELLRSKNSQHAGEAVAALREMSTEFSDDPAGYLGPHFEARAKLLETLAAGQLPEKVEEQDAYRAAAALWGLGAHRRDPILLQAALAILDRLAEEPYRAEKSLIRRWLIHLEDPLAAPRPPLPFD